MKSTTKMMVVAAVFLVAAAMFVMPAAARTVNSGDTIFDYEQDLNLSFAVNGDQLAKYTDDDPINKGQIYAIPVANATGFDLTAIDLQGNYGTYYLVSDVTKKIYIRDPSVSLDAVLADSITDSIGGKTVTKNTGIEFRLDATQVGTYLPTATVKIELTTPGGGKITKITDSTGAVQDLSSITLSSPRVYTQALDISKLEAGTYTAQAKWVSPSGFSDYATDSNSVSFTISTKNVQIESNKESVVRNNPFVITVSGDSKTNYYVYVKDASVAADQYPFIKPGQPSVNTTTAAQTEMSGVALIAKEWANITGTYAIVNTDAGGKRTVEFGTNTTTSDKTYTIKVVDPADTSKYDEVKVKVEKGDVTITAEGAGTYFLGEEIKLSGTNTDSDTVYLFMTGPNLGDQNGVKLDNISAYAKNGNYVERDVESDDTWEYRWDTSALAATGAVLDAGTYTIYAASASQDDQTPANNVDKSHLSGVKYKTFSVVLKQAFVTAQTTGTTLAKGDEFKITGTAEGQPSAVHIWIFGKNYRSLANSATVEDDGSFEYTIERAETQNLATGQYFAVVQHPMTDGIFNVEPVSPGSTSDFRITDATGSTIDLGRLAASDAATALVDALNSPNSDDTYAKLSFMVEEAWIRIDSIGDKAIGDTFTITGTTNLAVGDDLTVDVTSASFQPTEKTQSEAFSGSSGTVQVVEGTDYNTWSYDVDATNYKADQYTVKVESVDADVAQSATFNVLEAPATTTAPVTTAPVTTAPVTSATTTAPATTPTQPGFGALISLIGLGAVAFLVMRRN